jgi:quercetin dioxygenase-like cupin family protein
VKTLAAAAPEPRTDRPATAILHDEPNLRVIAFHLLPGQHVPPHDSAGTVVVQVISGTGTFTGDGARTLLGPGESAVYAPGERHAIEAGDGPLHFIALVTPRPS